MSESLWDFSIRVYQQPEVADACLLLQESNDVDVNVLLFCCWYGVYFGEMDQSLYKNVLSFSRSWSVNAVKPIRSVRVWMKNSGCSDNRMKEEDCQKLRNRIKAVELEAEKLQQEVLFSLVDSNRATNKNSAEQLSATIKNITLYMSDLGKEKTEDGGRALVAILRAVVPDSYSGDIENML